MQNEMARAIVLTSEQWFLLSVGLRTQMVD
jgi:hypothetical protein